MPLALARVPKKPFKIVCFYKVGKRAETVEITISNVRISRGSSKTLAAIKRARG